MWHRVRDVDKKRFVDVLLHEPNRFVGVSASECRHVGFWFNQFFVAVQIRNAVVASWRSVEVIESLPIGEQIDKEVLLRVFGEIPLSKARRRIALILQHFGDGNLVTVQDRMNLFRVASFGNSHRVASGHQRGSRRPANRLSIKAGELHSLGGHRIQSRSADIGRTKTAHILITLVVGKDHNEVWFFVVGDNNRGNKCNAE